MFQDPKEGLCVWDLGCDEAGGLSDAPTVGARQGPAPFPHSAHPPSICPTPHTVLGSADTVPASEVRDTYVNK